MSRRERLDRLERSLPPLESVLLWLQSAHAHDTPTEYLRTIIDRPDGQQPPAVIVARVEAWARASCRGEKRRIVEATIDEAVRDALLGYHVALAIESAADTFADRFEARLLLATERLADEVAGCRAGLASGDGHAASHHHRRLARLTLGRYEEERAALIRLEEHYLNGCPARFPTTLEAWDRLALQADVIASILDAAPVCSSGPETSRGDGVDDDRELDAALGHGDVEAAVNERMAALVDGALVRTHEYLDEPEADRVAMHRILDRAEETHRRSSDIGLAFLAE